MNVGEETVKFNEGYKLPGTEFTVAIEAHAVEGSAFRSVQSFGGKQEDSFGGYTSST